MTSSPAPRPSPLGPVVLVIGASSGIGLATARLLSQRGHRLALMARDAGGLEAAADACVNEVLTVPGDLSDPDDVRRVVGRVLERWGRLDAVITTAQTMAYGTVEDVPVEVFESIVETAVHGTAHLARAVLPVFRAQGGGTLVVVNSLLGEIAVPQMSSYVTAKWGQLGLVRSLQLEVRDDPGLHVCLVSPGAVDTPIYAQAATYAGRRGSAPPPVISPARVAAVVVDCLRRPRRHVEVGPANAITILGFRLAPWAYDRIVGPLVRGVVLRGPAAPPDPGNVLSPSPSREAEHGGWTAGGRLRQGPGGRARWRRRA